MTQTIYDGETAQDVESQPAAEIKHSRAYKAIGAMSLVASVGILGALGGYVYGTSYEEKWHCPAVEQTDVMAPGSQISFDNPKTPVKPDLALENQDGHLVPTGPLASAVHQDTKLSDPSTGELKLDTYSPHLPGNLRFSISGQVVTLNYVADPLC